MIYQPVNKTVEEILTAAQFTLDHPGARGWIRPTVKVKKAVREACVVMRAKYQFKGDPGHRMHALVYEGKIDLHYDFNRGGKHEVFRRSGLVKKCIEEFKKIDV